MKTTPFGFLAFVIAAVAMIFASCEDEISPIGEELGRGEVSIQIDSTFTITGKSIYAPNPDPRSQNNLIGRISVPEFGDLNCSFMAQLMSAGAMNIPDSINVERVDSMKLILRVPRGSFTGDSLAPQQLRAYKLTKPIQLTPGKTIDPKEYISDQTLLGSHTYTLGALGVGDSIVSSVKTISIPIMLDKEFARKVFTDYRNDPSVFQWPSTFVKYFPGIYVEPSFGRGAIANIRKADVVLYYYILKDVLVAEDTTAVTRQIHYRDSVNIFGTAPEVISINNISMKVAEPIKNRIDAGEPIIIAPSGYNVQIHLPIDEVIARFKQSTKEMTVLDNLIFSIPASTITNDYGIGVPPSVVLVKTKDADRFFTDNLLPDKKTIFWAKYNSTTGEYKFDSLRQFLLNLIDNDEELSPEDLEYTIIPVSLTTQEKQISYNQTEDIVTACNPYVDRPVMTLLHLDRAKLRFTYSTQKIK